MSVQRLTSNPSTSELNDMYLPAHNEIGDQDWFTKLQMKSNSKQKFNKQQQGPMIIGGVESRSNIHSGISIIP